MARVLAISSQVARGAVGLSAIVPALQALGHEAIALPTVLLSNHPGHARFAGERIAPVLLGAMLDAIEANGWLAEVDAVLTGYLPSVEHVAFAESAVDRVKARALHSIYLCDPVLGDTPKGLYIAQDAAEAIRERLVRRADLLKMNRFECNWLSGAEILCDSDAERAVSIEDWPATVVTSVPAGDDTWLSNVLAGGHEAPTSFHVRRRLRVPNGTGDLLSALWLGYQLQGTCSKALALERAVNGVERVVARSLETDELQLALSLGELSA